VDTTCSPEHLHMHTDLTRCRPQPGVGVERPTRRDAGSHSGVCVGGLPWESELSVTPCLGLLAQHGGQETPILLQGWLGGKVES